MPLYQKIFSSMFWLSSVLSVSDVQDAQMPWAQKVNVKHERLPWGMDVQDGLCGETLLILRSTTLISFSLRSLRLCVKRF